MFRILARALAGKDQIPVTVEIALKLGHGDRIRRFDSVRLQYEQRHYVVTTQSMSAKVTSAAHSRGKLALVGTLAVPLGG